MRLLIVEDDAPLASGLVPHPGGRGPRRRRDRARRGRRARRLAGAFRPGDPRHRPAAHGRLRGAAAPARGGKADSCPGAHGARRGRGPGARPRPRRRRLHGEAVRHAGAHRPGARAPAPLAGARRPAHRARPARARHGGAARFPAQRAARARGARMGGARGAARQGREDRLEGGDHPGGRRLGRRPVAERDRGLRLAPALEARARRHQDPHGARLRLHARRVQAGHSTRRWRRAASAHTCCACCCRRSRRCSLWARWSATTRRSSRPTRPTTRRSPTSAPRSARTCAPATPTTRLDLPPAVEQALRTDRYDTMFYRVLSPSGAQSRATTSCRVRRAQRRHHDARFSGESVRIVTAPAPCGSADLHACSSPRPWSSARGSRATSCSRACCPSMLIALATLVIALVRREARPAAARAPFRGDQGALAARPAPDRRRRRAGGDAAARVGAERPARAKWRSQRATSSASSPTRRTSCARRSPGCRRTPSSRSPSRCRSRARAQLEQVHQATIAHRASRQPAARARARRAGRARQRRPT